MAKKIILADSAGVCFGVEKAVSTAEEKLVQEQNVFSYGPLIHNPQTIEKLENKGLKVLDKIENKKGTITIRAHGITIEMKYILMWRHIHKILHVYSIFLQAIAGFFLTVPEKLSTV